MATKCSPASIAGIGCCNPVCPSANWAERNLPLWQIVTDGQSLGTVCACNASCAMVGGEMLAAQGGLVAGRRRPQINVMRY